MRRSSFTVGAKRRWARKDIAIGWEGIATAGFGVRQAPEREMQ
jgi:hypothetical protein